MKPVNLMGVVGDFEGAMGTAETAADHADSLLIGELEVWVALIAYMVAVGRIRAAQGTLTDELLSALLEIEQCAQNMIAVLDDFIEAGSQEIVFDGGEQ